MRATASSFALSICGEIDQALGARLHQPAHAVAHAENAPHLAGGGEACAQAFDHAGERLIDDGGRAAGLADHRIAGDKIRHGIASPL